MKIRRSMVVLFVMSALLIPISLYRSMFAVDASAELTGAVNIIYNVLMGIFLLLTFSFSVFTDDFPRSYVEKKSRFLGFITILLATATGYSSALGLLSEEHAVFEGMSGKVFSVIGILSVLSFMSYAVTYFKGVNIITSVALVPIFPAMWYGYRLLLCFLRSASMADISDQLPLIAMCCGFTIFSLTLGKLFSCPNSYSVKWAFVSGCVGILTTMLYTVNWLIDNSGNLIELISSPMIFTDMFMALFAIGSLFHISAPAQYFDDEQWDDYFYETYDLPKPNLVLHTPVDELEEDVPMDDDFDERPYIPVTATINSSPDQSAPAAPSYIANPQAYPAAVAPPVYPPAYPAVQQPVYYPTYPAAYPAYSYPPVPPTPAPGYEYYPAQPVIPAEYYDPYDAAAQQYQYERRRAELQSRELEKLTGEVDSSLARLSGSVQQSRGAVNEYVAASPDEKIGGTTPPAPTGRSVHLAQGYAQSGERITDHINRLEREAAQRSNAPQAYDDTDEYEDYTYEYYYPTDSRPRYSMNQFDPGRRNNGDNQNNGHR